jgi:DNA-binding NarL/FixJ family response regulator
MAAHYVSRSHSSYFSLRNSKSEINEALEAIFDNRRVIPLSIRGRTDDHSHLPDIAPQLTSREIEIIRHIADGKTAKKPRIAEW